MIKTERRSLSYQYFKHQLHASRKEVCKNAVKWPSSQQALIAIYVTNSLLQNIANGGIIHSESHLHSLNFTIKISKLWRLVEIAFEMFLFLDYFQLRTIWVYSTTSTCSIYVNMAQQPYLSCYVRYFYGHLLFIHQHISFIRHFFRGRILAEVSSGQKTHHNRCNLKHTMKEKLQHN